MGNHLTLFLTILLGIFLVAYILIRFNSLWIYRLFDRALTNPRDSIPRQYELPKYFKLGPQGNLDLAAKWPGWDGWYFFVIPQESDLPVRMIRASLMTGLYGLDGIDDYKLLPRGVSSFDAIEYLILVPTFEQAAGASDIDRTDRGERKNYLSHRYDPKQRLQMALQELSASIRAGDGEAGQGKAEYGSIQGKWPDYQFKFCDPLQGIALELNYHGEDLVWWADVPGIFTYFAAFGRFTGALTCQSLPAAPARDITPGSKAFAIRGSGAFEHGFARKPFNFDTLYRPVRWLQAVAPSFRPILYHYQLLVGEDGLHGGCMYARALGVEFRNRGGLYFDGRYWEIACVHIEYLESEEGDAVAAISGQKPLKFPTKWKVRATTAAGDLQFTATREWPTARIASNMMYYNHSFEGTFRGKKIQGRGYGEYLHI